MLTSTLALTTLFMTSVRCGLRTGRKLLPQTAPDRQLVDQGSTKPDRVRQAMRLPHSLVRRYVGGDLLPPRSTHVLDR